MVGYLFDQDAAQRPSLHAVQPEHPLFKVGAKKPPFFLKYYQNARVPSLSLATMTSSVRTSNQVEHTCDGFKTRCFFSLEMRRSQT